MLSLSGDMFKYSPVNCCKQQSSDLFGGRVSNKKENLYSSLSVQTCVALVSGTTELTSCLIRLNFESFDKAVSSDFFRESASIAS